MVAGLTARSQAQLQAIESGDIRMRETGHIPPSMARLRNGDLASWSHIATHRLLSSQRCVAFFVEPACGRTDAYAVEEQCLRRSHVQGFRCGALSRLELVDVGASKLNLRIEVLFRLVPKHIVIYDCTTNKNEWE